MNTSGNESFGGEPYEVAEARSELDTRQLKLGTRLLSSVPPPRSYFAAGGAALFASAVLVICLALLKPPDEPRAWGFYGAAVLVLLYSVGGLVLALERRRRYVMLLHALALEVQDSLHEAGSAGGPGSDKLRKDLLRYRAALIATGAVQQASDIWPSSRPVTEGPSSAAWS